MTSDDAIHRVAEAIAGAQPLPSWVETVRMVVNGVRGNYAIRTKYPKRKTLRRRLEYVRRGAELLAGEFNEGYRRDENRYAVIAHLVAAGLDQQTIIALALALPKLADCVASAAPIRDGKGSDKTFPNPDALSPHEQCAGLVTWGWYHLRGTRPLHTSKEAHSACEAVWEATGLPRTHFGNTLTGWRPHLETVERNLSNALPAAGATPSFRLFWDSLDAMADLHRNEDNASVRPQAKSS
jgi:hypothetical protein